jgi:hypothetical protein
MYLESSESSRKFWMKKDNKISRDVYNTVYKSAGDFIS